MTGNRMIARFCKGRGWTYNIGGTTGLGPKSTAEVLHFTYGYTFSEAREKMQHARNGSIVNLPVREGVSA